MASIDPNTLIWLLIAIIQIAPVTIAAIFSIRTHAVAKRTEILSQKVEVATNSMQDALVQAAKESSLAEGRELGRAEGALKAAALAEGRLVEQEKLP